MILTINSFSSTSFASGAAKTVATTGQNAFTRAVEKPLSGIVTPVTNTHGTPCNSVIECRKYGSDLSTVWQVNSGTDYSPKDYPERCYVLGKDGKYIYSQSAC